MATQAKTDLNPGAGPADQAASHDAALKLEEFLPYQLNVASSLVSQALSRIYVERYGIGVPEWRVLVTLGQFGVMTGKAIGAHSHMHKTKVSRAVANLEKGIRRKCIARRRYRRKSIEQTHVQESRRAIFLQFEFLLLQKKKNQGCSELHLWQQNGKRELVLSFSPTKPGTM